MKAILCLGNEPKVYGPFEDELQADWWLDDHGVDGKEGNWERCDNGLTPEEHHIEDLLETGIRRY